MNVIKTVTTSGRKIIAGGTCPKFVDNNANKWINGNDQRVIWILSYVRFQCSNQSINFRVPGRDSLFFES